MPNDEEIASQHELLEAHRYTLATYLRREALQGKANVVPEVTNGIREARGAISRRKAILRSWGVQVDDHPDDEEPAARLQGSDASSQFARPVSTTIQNSPVANLESQPDMHPNENTKQLDETFAYDVFISYFTGDPDETWVWETLVPRLHAAGVRIAVADDPRALGVARVISSAQAIEQSKRTLLVLTEAYVTDSWGRFERVLADTLGIEEGSYRLLPVLVAPIERQRIPLHLRALLIVDLSRPRFIERSFANLIDALQSPLPRV